jgi:hypothetical protein
LIRTFPRVQFYWLLLFELLRCYAQYRWFAWSPSNFHCILDEDDTVIEPRGTSFSVSTDLLGASHDWPRPMIEHIPFPHTNSGQTLIWFRSYELARPGLANTLCGELRLYEVW